MNWIEVELGELRELCKDIICNYVNKRPSAAEFFLLLFIYVFILVSKELWHLTIDIQVVNYLLRGWIRNLESSGSIALPLLDNLETTREHDTARDLEFVREGSKRSVRVRFYGSEFSLWNQISSYINTGFKDIKMKFG